VPYLLLEKEKVATSAKRRRLSARGTRPDEDGIDGNKSSPSALSFSRRGDPNHTRFTYFGKT
jgi:hypothetical protein